MDGDTVVETVHRSPFNDSLIASGSDDGKVRKIP